MNTPAQTKDQAIEAVLTMWGEDDPPVLLIKEARTLCECGETDALIFNHRFSNIFDEVIVGICENCGSEWYSEISLKIT